MTKKPAKGTKQKLESTKKGGDPRGGKQASKLVPRPKRKAIREGATPVEVYNSGLEVWLYDDANADAIREKGLWRKLVDGSRVDGMIVGYSLRQDDSINIDVVVGKALTAKELARGRWLAPQRSFLRLPSGKLAVESNDSCRVHEQAEDATETGAIVEVPPGDYSLTLIRQDLQALDRDEIEWKGAEEIVVLTPRGAAKEELGGLIPFEEPADTAWSGKITVSGSTAKGLVWFDDHWDSYFANIDHAAAEKLGLMPGVYFRTTVPKAGMTMVTCFATSWQEGSRLPPPEGPKLPEYGYGSIIVPQRWMKEALLAKRDRAAAAIKPKHQTQWLEATFEVLDLKPRSAKDRGTVLHAGKKRSFHASDLASKDYFDGRESDIAMTFDARVEGITNDQKITLADAIPKVDTALAALGLTPLGDFEFELDHPAGKKEFAVRAWTGAADHFAAVWAAEDSLVLSFFSKAGRSWLMTSTYDEGTGETITMMHERIQMQGTERKSVKEMRDLHLERLKGAKAKAEAVPATLAGLVTWYDDYVAAVVD